MDSKETKFSGFSREALMFLEGLELNNTRSWFEAHKQEYITLIRVPFEHLLIHLRDKMQKIDPLLQINARAISRIYRDTRFSKNKDPYRSTVWITLKRNRKDWADTPSYFFEITPRSYRYGMGFFSASPKTMRKLREEIDVSPRQFHKAISFYKHQRKLVIKGEFYRRIFDIAKSPEIQTWYQRKNIYLVCNRNINTILLGRKLIDVLCSDFIILASLYHYWWSIKDKSS